MEKRRTRPVGPEVKVGLVALSLMTTVGGWVALSAGDNTPNNALRETKPPAEAGAPAVQAFQLAPLPTVVPPPETVPTQVLPTPVFPPSQVVPTPVPQQSRIPVRIRTRSSR
ncbi:hypothetical protein HRbin23_00413 [bacterium HR23]|nr:hypothetical protein HRbin23_00413 [bacterium HR23]